MWILHEDSEGIFVLKNVIQCITMHFMRGKEVLKTVRLSQREDGLVQKFLKANPTIENFSSLARISILDLISKGGTIVLRPIVEEGKGQKVRPSFLWDYDLTEGQIREILGGPLDRRKWLLARILEHAKFGEIWKYLTLQEIERDLPSLRMNSGLKSHWEYAIKCWRKK